MMRVIAGQWRGKRLHQPDASITRPTTDRVREALFSMLLSRIVTFEGKKIIDAFAGSGALGIEALSRGASHCVFAENNLATRKVLGQNLKEVFKDVNDITEKTTLFSDVLKLPSFNACVDIIFLDPPYGAGLEFKVIEQMLGQTISPIGSETLIVLETQAKAIPNSLHDALENITQRVFGNCALSFWKIK